MPLILAFLLALAVGGQATPSIDDRLLPAWERLAGLPTFGSRYVAIVERTGVTVSIGDEAPINAARFLSDPPRIVLNESLLTESDAVLASFLAHELAHADQDPTIPCLEREVDAYAFQAATWRAFHFDGNFPTETANERALVQLVSVYEQTGTDGVQEILGRSPSTRRSCNLP